MKLKIYGGGRSSGRSELMEKYMDAWLKKNPDATIVRYHHGEIIIEKPIKEIKPKMIEDKR